MLEDPLPVGGLARQEHYQLFYQVDAKKLMVSAHVG